MAAGGGEHTNDNKKRKQDDLETERKRERDRNKKRSERKESERRTREKCETEPRQKEEEKATKWRTFVPTRRQHNKKRRSPPRITALRMLQLLPSWIKSCSRRMLVDRDKKDRCGLCAGVLCSWLLHDGCVTCRASKGEGERTD